MDIGVISGIVVVIVALITILNFLYPHASESGFGTVMTRAYKNMTTTLHARREHTRKVLEENRPRITKIKGTRKYKDSIRREQNAKRLPNL